MNEFSSPATVRKYIRENPWEPGGYGKGIVTPTGTVHLYRTSYDRWVDLPSDGRPSHAQAITALGAFRAGLVVIDPKGRFAFHASDERTNEMVRRVAEKHPDLEYRPDLYDYIY